jgi:hypothetical protein
VVTAITVKGLISTQLTGELNRGSCDLSWDLEVPIRTFQIILEWILLDSFTYIFELCKAKYIVKEMDVVLQVCTYPSARKKTVPDLPHAFECCWDTCEQTFNSSQRYFNHVETHVYCNPRGRKLEGVFLATGVVSNNFSIMNSHHHLH